MTAGAHRACISVLSPNISLPTMCGLTPITQELATCCMYTQRVVFASKFSSSSSSCWLSRSLSHNPLLCEYSTSIPSPQWPSVLPQYPAAEQHSPRPWLPVHVA
jgi:hypothetical protein